MAGVKFLIILIFIFGYWRAGVVQAAMTESGETECHTINVDDNRVSEIVRDFMVQHAERSFLRCVGRDRYWKIISISPLLQEEGVCSLMKSTIAVSNSPNPALKLPVDIMYKARSLGRECKNVLFADYSVVSGVSDIIFERIDSQIEEMFNSEEALNSVLDRSPTGRDVGVFSSSEEMFLVSRKSKIKIISIQKNIENNEYYIILSLQPYAVSANIEIRDNMFYFTEFLGVPTP